MRNTTSLTILIVLFLIGPFTPVLAQHYAFRTYTPSDGLPQSQIFTSFQDSAGYLWFSTLDGLCRYNGQEFVVFNDTNGLADIHVATIAEDNYGRVWFGTWAGGASYYDPNSENPQQLTTLTIENSNLPDNRINCFFNDPNGDFWIGSNGGITRLRFDSKESYRMTTYNDANGLLSLWVNAIFRDRYHRLWVGTWGGGLGRFDPDQQTFIIHEGLPESRLAAATSDHSGGYWLAFAHGFLAHFDINPDSLAVITTYNIAEWGIAERINGILQSSEKTLWISTWHSGILTLKIDENHALSQPEIFSTHTGLASNQIRCLLEDREGNIWIGTNGGGLGKFQSKMFRNFTTANGLPQNLISAIVQDEHGQFWIGTYDEGLCRYDGQTFTYINDANGLPNNGVQLLFIDDQQRIWIGTRRGLCYFEKDRIHTNYQNLSMQHISAISAGQMKDGSIWFGTNGRGIHILRDNQFSELTINDGLASAHARTIIQSRDGRIWIGSNDGLQIFDGENFTHYTTADGLLDNQVSMLFEDSAGRIWIVSDGNRGITYYEGHQFHGLSTADGLSTNVVYSVTEDRNGNLWFGHNRGVDRYDGRNFFRFNELDGIVKGQCSARAAICDRDGYLWFGTIGGLSRIDVTLEKQNNQPPPVYIESMAIFDQPVNLKKPISLNYKENYISFAFHGLSFTNEQEVRYRYILEGIDKEWTGPTPQHQVKYTNLPPGDYIFQVEAHNNDGVWSSKPARVEFTILAPFWQRIWFLILAVIGLIVIVYVTITWRTYQLKKQKASLEAVINERTEEVVRKNLQLYERQEIIAEKNQEMLLKNAELEIRQKTISRQKDELEHRKVELENANRHLAELNEQKNQFLGMAAHDLRNPLSVISSYTEILEFEDMDDRERKMIYGQLSKLSRHMHEMVSNLLDVVAIESGKVNLELAEGSIELIVNEAIGLFSFKAEKKNIRLIKNLKPDLPLIIMDQSRIMEVLNNLISNAIKYSHPDTSVTVSVTKSGSNEVTFSVRDEGVGLSADDLKKVFGSFQKLSARPTAGESSTGLGLAIVKKLVELHHGHVWVESEVGVGSTFFFALPITQPEPE